MRFFLFVAAVAAVLSPLAARADTKYYFSNTTLTDNSPVSGYLSVDTAGGTVTGGEFTAEGATFNLVGYSNGPDYPGDTVLVATADFDSASEGFFALYFPAFNLVGYSGGLCTVSSDCTGFYYRFGSFEETSYFEAVDGSTLNVAAGSLSLTPEPGSLMLLGTGMLGMLGAARRRFVRG